MVPSLPVTSSTPASSTLSIVAPAQALPPQSVSTFTLPYKGVVAAPPGTVGDAVNVLVAVLVLVLVAVLVAVLVLVPVAVLVLVFVTVLVLVAVAAGPGMVQLAPLGSKPA